MNMVQKCLCNLSLLVLTICGTTPEFLQNIGGNNESDHPILYMESIQEEAERKASLVFVPEQNPWIYQASKTLGSFLSFISTWNKNCWVNHDQGTCLSRKSCTVESGSFGGICAGGFGVCCIRVYHCGSVTPYNRTYFTNQGFPQSSADGICEHRVIKVAGICQLRLDFEVFELDPPGDHGHCNGGALVVDGTERAFPPLCGDLTGHHVYIQTSFEPEVRLTFNPGHSPSRWKLRVTRLECSSPSLASGGCDQFHHGVLGRITSLNYLHSNIFGLDYGVCVKKEKGFCAIQWSLCHDENVHWERKRREITRNVLTNVAHSNYFNKTHCNNTRNPRDKSCNSEESEWRPFVPAYFNQADTDQRPTSHQLPSVPSSTPKSYLSRSNLPKLGLGLVRLKNPTSKLTDKKSKGSGVILKSPPLYQQLKIKGPSTLSVPSVNKFQQYHLSPLGSLNPKPFNGHYQATKPKIFSTAAKSKPNLKLPNKGTLLKPPVHSKTKPFIKPPFKGIGHKGKVKPKPVHKHKVKGHKPKGHKNCKVAIVPFPFPLALPIPIPIPITPVVVVPFPVGGGAGGHEHKGWKEDGKIYSATEPFLLRIKTGKEEDGLNSFCMDWEQIPCHTWKK